MGSGSLTGTVGKRWFARRGSDVGELDLGGAGGDSGSSVGSGSRTRTVAKEGEVDGGKKEGQSVI